MSTEKKDVSAYAVKHNFALTNDFIWYTDPYRVVKVITLTPKANPYASGYGPKIPTQYGIEYRINEREGVRIRPRRVWAMLYGNSASLWIDVRGEVVFLDTDTEYRIQKMRDAGEYEG